MLSHSWRTAVCQQHRICVILRRHIEGPAHQSSIAAFAEARTERFGANRSLRLLALRAPGAPPRFLEWARQET